MILVRSRALLGVSVLALVAAGAVSSAFAACNPTGTNQTCTNSTTLDGGANRAIYDSGNLNLTNTSTGVIKSTVVLSTVVTAGTLTLDNAGSIYNTTANAGAISASGGATVTNRVTGIIEGKASGGGVGLNVGVLGVGTLRLENYGLIHGDTAIHTGDGTINNHVGATIVGASQGVLTDGTNSTINNDGNIFTNATGGQAIYLTSGGTVNTFQGSLTQADNGTAIYGYSETKKVAIDNAGQVYTVNGGDAIVLNAAGSTVVNEATGTISGRARAIVTSGGVITNSGTIRGGTGPAIDDLTSVSLVNTATGIINSNSTASVIHAFSNVTLDNAGQISGTGAGADAVVAGTGTATVVNRASGTIVGNDAGVLASAALKLDNYGSIAGGTFGATGNTGSVVNNYASGQINGGNYGVWLIGGGGMVHNQGTVTTSAGGGAGVGVRISGGGGSLVNDAGATVSGGDTGFLANMSGAVVANAGTIRGSTTAGVQFVLGGGTLTNSSGGLISGGDWGVFSGQAAPSTIDNFGTIKATSIVGLGVQLNAVGDRVTNHAGATISGAQFGIGVTGNGSTISNAGVISGGAGGSAISYDPNTTGHTLNINPGASFVGGIDWSKDTGNTTTFGLGSYTVGVKNYKLGQNTTNINKAFQVLTTTLDANGTGNLVVTDTGSASLLGALPGAVISSTMAVIDDVLDMDIERPDAHRLPKPGTYGPLAYADSMAAKAKLPAAILINENTAIDAFGNLVWMRAGGGVSDRASTATRVGDNTRAGTLTLGLDRIVNDWRLGFFLGGGAASSSLSSNAGKVQSDLGYGGVYARHDFGALTFDSALLVGGLSAKTDRSVTGVAGMETASGTDRGWFIAPEVALSTRYVINPEWSLTPKLSVHYAHAGFGAYSESGSSQNAAYGAHAADGFVERAELKLTRHSVNANGLSNKIWLTGAVFDTQTLGKGIFRADILGNDLTIDPNLPRSALGASIGLGAEAQLSRAASVYGTVTGTAADDHTKALTVRGGVKVGF
ncbi:autotransporter outer membrane beta-barrel domain-containing protein [Bradyrhizobium sp. BR13661]|jgi:hypothetical protein|uniref:autotransporter outer membrane beta-barrel domain-containing protein n=2 Tax=Pseudomonadota TaxID=1224 RepID=UPI0024769A91|nr:autotransporter outer membrane beta-barrel domain-containing protein [Bradyrhizobium sp. BR13661]MDH6258470.1 hypothetical protein [Bradyrhizobium sp. BR13661]